MTVIEAITEARGLDGTKPEDVLRAMDLCDYFAGVVDAEPSEHLRRAIARRIVKALT